MTKDKYGQTEFLFGDRFTSMTAHCFDEESEMALVIKSGRQRIAFKLTIEDARDLKKFITTHLKNETGKP